MFTELFSRLWGGKGKTIPRGGDERTAGGTVAPPAVTEAPPDSPAGFLCREAVLDRDHRVAGYQLMLHEGARHRARSADRRVHHAYAEVLVRTAVRFGNGLARTDRRAFLDLPDSFLDHPAIGELAPACTVLVIDALEDAGAPPPEILLPSVSRLRDKGFGIAIPDPAVVGALGCLLPVADHVVVHAAATDAERLAETVARLRQQAPAAALLARDVPSEEHVRFCHGLGADLFQGPFVTRREDWHGRELATGTARLAELLNRLRRGAEIRELSELLKQDAALALRLMRYINSAAVGLHEHVSSIERALMLLGRERLYRWLTVLLYSADHDSPRASAALENALVRARLMELLGEGRTPAERDALFLAGLLSLIDVVLELPIEQALSALHVAPEIEAAVVDGRGPLADLLQLAVACETMNAERVAAAAGRCGVSATAASACHLDALTWALQLDT